MDDMAGVHEVMYYLTKIKEAIDSPAEDAFKPAYLVVAIKLPTGAIELQVNSANISEKIDYILEKYDHATATLVGTDISIQNILVV